MIGNIPEGWREKKLGDIVNLIIGKTPSRNIPEYFMGNNLWTSIRDMNNYIISTTKEKITDEAIKASRIKKVKKNTLLLSYKLSIGKLSFAGEDLYTNEAIAGLNLLDNSIHNKFLYYVLKATDLERTVDRAVMGKTLNKAKLQVIPIAYPPLPQQEKIVKVLDISSSLIEKQKELLQKYDLFLKSKFIEMFGDPILNPMGWEVVRLGNITNKITDGTHKTPKYQTDGIKFVSAKNIKKEQLNFYDCKYISEEEHQTLIQRCNPEYKDILLTKSGSIGMSSIVPKVDFPFSLFESLCLIKFDFKKIKSFYLREFLNSNSTKHQYKNLIKGIAIKHLHLKDVRSLKIPIPPITLQNKFAKIVEKTEQIKMQETQKLEHLQTLHNSLMDKAFKGEIT